MMRRSEAMLEATRKIILHPDAIETEILFSPGIRKKIYAESAKGALIMDKRVHVLFGEGSTPLLTLQGEISKSWDALQKIVHALFEAGFNRDCTLIAVGGGTVTDLASFTASIFCRGVSLILVPTTLLAMVDAAIGGKTAINLPYGKNLLGTFYPAEKILIDPEFLTTLPDKEWRAGLAETIKHALIGSAALFERLFHVKNLQELKAYVEPILWESIEIKRAIVEEDFQERGRRRCLNFGHTIAHALELCSGYRMPHGEAVAVGLIAEAYLSVEMGFPSQDLERLLEMLKKFKFPLKIAKNIKPEMLLEAMKRDKKAKEGVPRFVLLKRPGACAAFDGEYCAPADPKILRSALDWLYEKLSHKT